MSFVSFFAVFWIIASFAWVRINHQPVRSKLWYALEHILVLPYTIIMIISFAYGFLFGKRETQEED